MIVCGCCDQVLSNQQLLQRHKNDLLENEDRVNNLSQHLKNVRQELQLTQVHSETASDLCVYQCCPIVMLT